MTWKDSIGGKGWLPFPCGWNESWVTRERGEIEWYKGRRLKNFEYSAKKFGLHNGGKRHVRP